MQVLGYQPEVSLDEGVRRFSTWFKQYYGTALDAGAPVPEDWVSFGWLPGCHELLALLLKSMGLVGMLYLWGFSDMDAREVSPLAYPTPQVTYSSMGCSSTPGWVDVWVQRTGA